MVIKISQLFRPIIHITTTQLMRELNDNGIFLEIINISIF